MADWQETKKIMLEFEQLFTTEDDLKDVLDIHKMQKEIANHSQQRLRDVRDTIKAMTSSIEKKEQEIRAPTQSEHSATLRKISEKENYQQQMDTILKSIDNKRTNIMKVTSTSVTLQERAQEFTMNSHMADSRTAYAISLYAKISNITWDYNAAQGHLAGCIGNDRKKELKTFYMNVSSLNSYETANQLWDMIGDTLQA